MTEPHPAEDCEPLLSADGAPAESADAGSLAVEDAGLARQQGSASADTHQQPLPPPACRICLQDDDPASLENPCSCSGSMAVSEGLLAGVCCEDGCLPAAGSSAQKPLDCPCFVPATLAPTCSGRTTPASRGGSTRSTTSSARCVRRRAAAPWQLQRLSEAVCFCMLPPAFGCSVPARWQAASSATF